MMQAWTMQTGGKGTATVKVIPCSSTIRTDGACDLFNYRVSLRFLDGLVVELFIENLHFTQVVRDAGTV